MVSLQDALPLQSSPSTHHIYDQHGYAGKCWIGGNISLVSHLMNNLARSFWGAMP
jgi:hypothetical protein